MSGPAAWTTRTVSALAVLLAATVSLSGCAPNLSSWRTSPMNPPVIIFSPDLTCRVRNSRGEVVRSSARVQAFKVATGYASGRPGWIVDHLIPLCAGGCDTPSSMVWMPEAEAKVKDRWERDYCAGRTTLSWCEWKVSR